MDILTLASGSGGRVGKTLEKGLKDTLTLTSASAGGVGAKALEKDVLTPASASEGGLEEKPKQWTF